VSSRPGRWVKAISIEGFSGSGFEFVESVEDLGESVLDFGFEPWKTAS
jgi:hypothetical protein